MSAIGCFCREGDARSIELSLLQTTATMNAILTVDGYDPVDVRIARLVTIEADREIIELSRMPDGKWRLVASKSLMIPEVENAAK